MIYQNESPENITGISKTALKDFYEIRSLLNTAYHNEKHDIKNADRAYKWDKNYVRAIAICEKWINAKQPIELD